MPPAVVVVAVYMRENPEEAREEPKVAAGEGSQRSGGYSYESMKEPRACASES